MKKLLLTAAICGSMIAGEGAFAITGQINGCLDPQIVAEHQKGKKFDEDVIVTIGENVWRISCGTEPVNTLKRGSATLLSNGGINFGCEYNGETFALVRKENCQNGYK